MKSLVAIVIPVCNMAQFLPETLDALLLQTYEDWRCVINDNCSSDSSYEIARSYAAKDSRFTVHRNESTIPPVDNWNKAYSFLEKVDAEYARLQPADDWIFPEYLEKMVGVLESSPAAGICLCYEIYGTELKGGGLDLREGPFFDGKRIIAAEARKEMYLSGTLGTALYRVSALKEISPGFSVYAPGNLHGDLMLAHDVMSRHKVGFVFQVLTWVRRHDAALSSFSIRVRSDFYGWEEEFMRRLPQMPELDPAYRSHRLEYAWFLFRRFLAGDVQALEWHRSRLQTPLAAREYFLAILGKLRRWITLYWDTQAPAAPPGVGSPGDKSDGLSSIPATDFLSSAGMQSKKSSPP